MVSQMSSIVIGVIIALITVMIGMIVIKVLQRYKVTDSSIKELVMEYEETLLEIGQLCLDIMTEDKSSMTHEEYNKKIMDMTADYFRVFLKEETEIPRFVVDSITGEHMFDIIDYIDMITKMKLQDLDTDEPKDIDIIESINEELGYSDTSKDNDMIDISKDINSILDDIYN